MSSATTRYPLGTVAIYGPTDKLATKIVASIFPTPQKEPAALRKWSSSGNDIREDPAIRSELTAFLKEHSVAHAVVTEEVVGCPHEEGKDYPAGQPCPQCPFWANRPRRAPRPAIIPTANRNDPCPCGSGKKYKKCCGT